MFDHGVEEYILLGSKSTHADKYLLNSSLYSKTYYTEYATVRGDEGFLVVIRKRDIIDEKSN